MWENGFNGFRSLTIFAKSSVLVVWQSSKYTSHATNNAKMKENIILFYPHKFETLIHINNFQTFFSPSANVIDWSDWIFIGAPLSKAALKLAHNSLSTPFKRKKIPRNSYSKLLYTAWKVSIFGVSLVRIFHIRT